MTAADRLKAEGRIIGKIKGYTTLFELGVLKETKFHKLIDPLEIKLKNFEPSGLVAELYSATTFAFTQQEPACKPPGTPEPKPRPS